ncbi:hypothetical protein [Cohnella kolymensis]|uniref:hypothetical protein n=1 Tax=Cohnella kolymensis TaxID=1590652 RepID=UPI000597C9E0|nr:hypothetical protein [Cohnella kolymensis]
MSANYAQRPESPPSFAHLRRMTDDTGLLEHALGRTPRRVEGYCVDDNCRALWTVTEWLSLDRNTLSEEDRDELTRMADIYLAFLLWTQPENGWWHNNIAYDRSPEDLPPSDDCQGRAIWACADAWIRLDGPQLMTAQHLCERAIPTLTQIESQRGQAWAMATCAHLLEAADTGVIELQEAVKNELKLNLERLEAMFTGAFRHFSDDNWHWFEPGMTYSNGIFSWAMLRTYRYTRRPDTLDIGLQSLSFLLEVMTAEEGWLRPIGNQGWGSADSVSRWDQQPLEMFKLALALEEAAAAVSLPEEKDSSQLVTSSIGTAGKQSVVSAASNKAGVNKRTELTNHSHYRAMRDLCRNWFYGDNDLQVPMADPTDGSCCDGLRKNGANRNCGAESTLSYLMTEALCRRA